MTDSNRRHQKATEDILARMAPFFEDRPGVVHAVHYQQPQCNSSRDQHAHDSYDSEHESQDEDSEHEPQDDDSIHDASDDEAVQEPTSCALPKRCKLGKRTDGDVPALKLSWDDFTIRAVPKGTHIAPPAPPPSPIGILARGSQCQQWDSEWSHNFPTVLTQPQLASDDVPHHNIIPIWTDRQMAEMYRAEKEKRLTREHELRSPHKAQALTCALTGLYDEEGSEGKGAEIDVEPHSFHSSAADNIDAHDETQPYPRPLEVCCADDIEEDGPLTEFLAEDYYDDDSQQDGHHWIDGCDVLEDLDPYKRQRKYPSSQTNRAQRKRMAMGAQESIQLTDAIGENFLSPMTHR